jgi:hypothetical protein
MTGGAVEDGVGVTLEDSTGPGVGVGVGTDVGVNILGSPLSMVRVGKPSGGGRKSPGTATSGRRTKALKPAPHVGELDTVANPSGHPFLHAAADSLGAQYHTGSTTIVSNAE